MNEIQAREWISEVVGKFPDFIQSMKDPEIPGRFKYSETGDIYPPEKWGLGNTVFAIKCCYMLKHMDLLESKDCENYIKSFQDADGNIFDKLVLRKSKLDRFRAALETYRPLDFFRFNKMSVRAQTRQAVAALQMLRSKPDYPYMEIPSSTHEIEAYVNRLNWSRPWSAASHVNHLAFFLTSNQENFGLYENYPELQEVLLKNLKTYRKEDGSWGEGAISPQQKINGAMKALLVYNTLGIDSFSGTTKLIDLCLSVPSNEQACNNLNTVLVIYNCTRKEKNYRKEEIRKYCLERLSLYKDFYKSTSGGFSFWERKANSVYYWAKLTKGKNESDIHASHLFLWGICLANELLELGFKLSQPIT